MNHPDSWATDVAGHTCPATVRSTGRSGVHRFLANFTPLIAGLEPRFVPFASDLCRVIAYLKGLINTAEAGLISTRDQITGKAFATLREQADGVISDLGRRMMRMRQLDALLRALGGDLFGLRCSIERVRALATFLKACGTKFAIESARHAAAWPAATVFVEELRSLARQIGELAVRIETDSAGTEAKLRAASKFMGESVVELEPLVDHVRHALFSVTEDVGRIVTDNLQATERVEAHKGTIERESGKLVYYLQFGDLVRQKCEHVESALSDCDRAAKGGLPSHHIDGELASIVDTQTAQLGLIHEELAAARANLSGSYSSLREEMQALRECCRALGGSGTHSPTSPWARLKLNLATLQRIRQRSLRVDQDATDTASRVSAAAAALQERSVELHQVSERLHMLALNAIIQTAGLRGEGNTLGELARQVELLHRECDVVRAQVLSSLARISDRVKRIGGDEIAPKELGINVLQEWEQLHTHSDRLATELLGSLHKGGVIIDQSERRLEELRILAEDIDEQQRFLAGVVGNDTPRSSCSAQVERFLAQHYTMESEREIHRRVRSGGALPVDRMACVLDEKPLCETVSATLDDSLGENVELF